MACCTDVIFSASSSGISHSNSSSNQFDGTSLTTPPGYLRWLSFICHEYFHNFNVKRIRPLALGREQTAAACRFPALHASDCATWKRNAKTIFKSQTADE